VLIRSARAATLIYWSLFNEEGASSGSAIYVTYGALSDMLADTNRLGAFPPGGGGAARNVVGSGSDGSTYWSLFNEEGESAGSAIYVTYGTLSDMLADTNRLGAFPPGGGGAARNVVGSGAFVVPHLAPVPLPASGALLAGAVGVFVAGRRRRVPT
jgi:hypothetical protein